MDYAVRNTRVLIRACGGHDPPDGAAPPTLAEAVALLAEAVRALGTQLAEPGGELAVRRAALRAASTATSLLREDPDLSSVVIVGQIRSTAVDLLRGSGLGAEEARRSLEAVTEHHQPATDVALRTVPRAARPPRPATARTRARTTPATSAPRPVLRCPSNLW